LYHYIALHMLHRKRSKKNGDTLTLELERTPDILLELGKKKQKQLLVEFAAETDELENNAMEKMSKKNLDIMVANDITVPGAGFGTDTNVAKLVFTDGTVQTLAMMDKEQLGNIILDNVKRILSSEGKK